MQIFHSTSSPWEWLLYQSKRWKIEDDLSKTWITSNSCKSCNSSLEWVSQYINIWNELESQLFEKLATEPIKGNNVRGKLKTWKERIKTNFHGQNVSYHMYCNATAVLKIDSVYKQGKNYHPQTYVEECKYTDVENWNLACFHSFISIKWPP